MVKISSVLGFIKIVRVDLASEKHTATVSKPEFRPLRGDLEKACIRKLRAGVGNVLRRVVVDVDGETGWIDDDVVVVEKGEDFVVDWRHPVNALDHSAHCFCHHKQVGVEWAKKLGENPENLYWISGKTISGASVTYPISHELVVTLRLLATKKRLAACYQQTTSSWPENRMYTNELNRFKVTGANAAQTPSSASAPDQLETLVGAGAREVTATNQSTRTAAGGGRYGAI